MDNYYDADAFTHSSMNADEDDNRFVSAVKQNQDNQIENVLRPKTMDEYIGQKKVKDNLLVYISAAKKRKMKNFRKLFFEIIK